MRKRALRWSFGAMSMACGLGMLVVSPGEAQAQFNPDHGSVSVEDCAPGMNIIEGTEGADNLNGTNGDDCIVGYGGDDNINGRGGNDIIIGGGGVDDIRGGNGDDIIFGGEGDDIIRGGRDNDSIFGGSGNDRITGGSGADVHYGQSGDDLISGGSGDDITDGGPGIDDLRGGRDNDILIGSLGDDILRAGSGDDFLLGGDGLNTLRGGRGLDACDFDICVGDDITQGQIPSALLLASDARRTDPGALHGDTVHGNIFAFVADNDIAAVRFYLDDTGRTGRPIFTDNLPPFDFCGTNDLKNEAYPFPTPRFTRNGTHSITAEIEHLDGSLEVISGTFTVDN